MSLTYYIAIMCLLLSVSCYTGRNAYHAVILSRIRAFKNPVPDITIGPFNFLPKWIKASEKVNRTMRIWYPLQASGGDIYILSRYNESSKNVTFLRPPCGRVPSTTCLHEMINVSITHANEFKYCDKQVYNPMLRAMPYWGLHVTLQKGENSLFRTDSGTASFLGLSAMIARMLQMENTTCDQGTIFPSALSKNTVRLSKHINKTRIAAFFKKLKIKRNSTSTKFKTSNSSTPLTVQQFLDYTNLVYVSFRMSAVCNVMAYDQDLMKDTDVVSLPYGKFNTSALRAVDTYDNLPHVPVARPGVMRGYLHIVYLKTKVKEILDRRRVKAIPGSKPQQRHKGPPASNPSKYRS